MHVFHWLHLHEVSSVLQAFVLVCLGALLCPLRVQFPVYLTYKMCFPSGLSSFRSHNVNIHKPQANGGGEKQKTLKPCQKKWKQ